MAGLVSLLVLVLAIYGGFKFAQSRGWVGG